MTFKKLCFWGIPESQVCACVFAVGGLIGFPAVKVSELVGFLAKRAVSAFCQENRDMLPAILNNVRNTLQWEGTASDFCPLLEIF